MNKRRRVFKRRSTDLRPILNKRRSTAITYQPSNVGLFWSSFRRVRGKKEKKRKTITYRRVYLFML